MIFIRNHNTWKYCRIVTLCFLNIISDILGFCGIISRNIALSVLVKATAIMNVHSRYLVFTFPFYHMMVFIKENFFLFMWFLACYSCLILNL